MTALFAEGLLVLEGTCGAEDAEPLLRLILDNPGTAVDWSACRSAHTAVIQVLCAARIRPLGTPEQPFLRDVLGPAMLRLGGSIASDDEGA